MLGDAPSLLFGKEVKFRRERSLQNHYSDLVRRLIRTTNFAQLRRREIVELSENVVRYPR